MSCIPDAAKTQAMYALYQEGQTCSQIALAFQTTRQSVWERFKRRGLKLRPCPRNRALPCITWGGARWAPDKDGYFRRTQRAGAHARREVLHRAMWEAAHGRLRRGAVVGFRDGDRMNVTLDNLVCLPKDEACTMLNGGALRFSAQFPRLKRCLACDSAMGRRVTGNHAESPAAYRKRKTCNADCSAAWKRGRARGARMPA